MALRPCLTCGTPANGPRCSEHRRRPVQPSAHARGLGRTHQRLARQTIERWVRENGWICPGWGRDPHPVAEGALTGEHKLPRSTHPELAHDPDNYGVLCGPCNSRKGAH
jgi:5-methylcytosine-specific restriction endonuclease McrA